MDFGWDNKIPRSFRYGIIKSHIFVVGIVKAGCFELNVGLINILKSFRMIIKQNLFEHWFVFLLGEWGQLMNLVPLWHFNLLQHDTSGITACLPKLRRQQCRCKPNIRRLEQTTLRNETQS